MNVEAYLNRINYTGYLIPDLEVLKNLQKNHLLHVPFENLDIHYGKTINLDVGKFYHKIVEEKRGGFCYELNGLFNTLLNALGYNSSIISARVYDVKRENFGKEFDHMAMIIELNQAEYLVDAGFGEFAFHPLPLETGTVQTDPRGDFIIEEFKNDYLMVSRTDGETRTPQYIFTRQKRELNEFREMCHYHQTSPDSHFTQKRLISKPTETGRITITGNTLKIIEGGKVIKECDFRDDDFETYVKEWFRGGDGETGRPAFAGGFG